MQDRADAPLHPAQHQQGLTIQGIPDDEQSLLPSPPSDNSQHGASAAAADHDEVGGGDKDGDASGGAAAAAAASGDGSSPSGGERPRPPPAPWHPLQNPQPPRKSSRFWSLIRGAPQHARICFAYNRGTCTCIYMCM